jgi:hypothetical protein
MSKDSKQLGFDIIKSHKKSYKLKKKNINTEKSLIFSKKIIALLEEKLKNYNNDGNKKLTLFDLKKAYKSGFEKESNNFNKETLAQVNVLLRIMSGKSNEIFSAFKSNDYEISGREFVIKGNLIPTELDYSQAEEDIKNYKLENFDFKSIEELYLEDEEDRVIYLID